MIPIRLRPVAVAFTVAAVALVAPARESRAGSKDTKEECTDAHGKGQDLRDKGQLVRARQMFVACAQSSCPSLVQGDCARLGEELSHLVPTITFSARDATAADLPNTSVYVDDVLVTSRLDDGRAFEVDPGKHVARFVHAGKEASVKVIVAQGEKGRLVVATFADENVPMPTTPPPSSDASSSSHRPVFPLIVAGLGGAAAITGGVLFGLGMSGVPGNCSVGSHECAAPASDPSIDKAQSSMTMADIGLGVGIAGAVTLIGGLVWYFASPSGSGGSQRGSAPSSVITF